MRTISVALAVLLGAVLVFMAGAGFAADYAAFLWPADFAKRTDDYRFGYMAGVGDTIIYTQAAGVPGSKLTSAYTCVRNTKTLTAGQLVQVVSGQLGNNPQNTDTVAASVITALDACKFPAQAGGGNTIGKNNNGMTLRRRP